MRQFKLLSNETKDIEHKPGGDTLKKKITTLLMAVLFGVLLAGCGGKSSGYEGAGMKIKYNTSDWSIFYRQANENTNIIELYSDKGGGLSIMSCEAEPGSAEEIYQGMITSDQLLGQVSGMSAQNNMAEEKGTASYAHRTKTNFSSDYWTLFYGKNAGDGRVLLAAATIYINDEDEANQCKQEIEKIIDSLTVSDQTDLGEATKAMIDPDVQTNVLVNYINGGQKYYSYMEGSQAAKAEPVSVEGFEYVQKMALKDEITGMEAEVYGPVDDTSYLSASGIFYIEHGINFSLFLVGDWSYSSPQEQLSIWQQETVRPLKDNAVRYQNLSVDDLVTVEEGLCYYQHTSVEELDAQENATTNHYLVYVGTTSNGIGYMFSLEVMASSTDGETNQILEEIGKCYDLDLAEYGNSAEDLNNAGERVDMSQDVYTQKSGEPEIRAIEGYTYMGASELSDYDGNIYELLIPMGRNTSNSGYSLFANMHGVSISVSVTSIYRNMSIAETLQESMQYRYDSLLENSRDYKNVTMGEVSATTEGEGLYGSISADHADYDGLVFPYHEIDYQLKMNDDSALEISIRLDERNYDVHTNVLLEEIEQAYRMDLSEFYYEP